MAQLEKLGEFFSKYSVVLDNFDYNPVSSNPFPSGKNCVLVDFNAGDINLTARRGLSWAGRMGFKGFGISRDVVRFGKPISKLFLYRITKPMREKYYQASCVDYEYLKDHDREAEKIMNQWMENRRFPSDVALIFEDQLECQEKLLDMLGYRTYKHHRNRNFGESSDLMMAIATRNSQLMRKIRENDPAEVSDLVKMINPIVDAICSGVDSLKQRCDKSEFPDKIPGYYDGWNDDLRKAGKLLSEAAYEVRRGYKKNGWEVRDGLVKEASYPKLLRIVYEMGADSGKAALIISAHFGDYHDFYIRGNFRNIFLSSLHDNGFFERIPYPQEGWYQYYIQIASSWFKEKKIGLSLHVDPPSNPDICDSLSWPKEFFFENNGWNRREFNFCNNVPHREFPYVTPKEYYEIGKLRLEDFRKGHLPYKRERIFLEGILRVSLNKKNFKNLVDRNIGNVDWIGVDEEIWRIKSGGEYNSKQVI